MKPISRSARLALVATLAFCLADALLLTLVPGCGTNAPTKAAQGEQILITSVNAGMDQWVAYVNSGKAKQSQIDAVHNAYDAYYAAQQVAKAVIEKAIAGQGATQADVTTANQAVTNAENVLLALLNQFIK